MLAATLAASGTAVGGGALLARADAAPEGCEAHADYYMCSWSFNSTDASAQPLEPRTFDIPVFARTLATVTVVLNGADAGWLVQVVERTNESTTNVSNAQHAQQSDASYSHRQRTTHVVFTQPSATYFLRVTPGNAQLQQQAIGGLAAISPGRYYVSYLAEALPPGVAPDRPAATMADPHLVDLEDFGGGSADIVAAWFDDERLGDGLMDAHLRVADLARVDFTSPVTGQTYARIEWKLAFAVVGAPYYVAWEMTPGDGAGKERFTCAVRRESTAAEESEEVLANPRCTLDRDAGVFHASFPERSIGSPAPGEVFGQLTARSRLFNEYGLNEVVDDDPEKRYDFALGGPAVWSALDGGRKDPPAPAALAWYEDPLSTANLPDTLQVAGAVLAALTFLTGLLFLWRSRRDMRRLLHRIDVVEQANEHDARQALIELGRLESELTRDFRHGRIRDTQYQVAAQRIASVAARLALRRDLGLDDGSPDAIARRIPVLDRDAADESVHASRTRP